MGTMSACPVRPSCRRRKWRRIRPQHRYRTRSRSRASAGMMSTTDDIRYLIGLARDKSVESRKRLVAVVSDIFFSDQAVLTEYERALITEILHKLIYELAAPVRETLCMHLAGNAAMPHSLADRLAADEVEVAA